MKTLLILCMMFLLAYAKDSKQIDTVDIPFKEATMLKGYQEVLDISIHAQTVNEDMQENYFDENLLDDGVYAVLVRITNNSRTKVIMYSRNAKLLTASTNKSIYPLQDIIEPYQSSILNMHSILGTVGVITSLGMSYGSGAKDKYDGDGYAKSEAIRNDFYKKTLKETLMYPGDTISGFIFFKLKDKKGKVSIKGQTSIKVEMQFMNSLKKYDLITNVIKFK